MRIIPAVDLRGGRCVRLMQGDYAQETVYGEDPVAVATVWLNAGARRLHLVDLDGARDGRPAHLEVLRQTAARAGKVPIQFGGGLRRREDIEAVLEAGARWAIIGTSAIREPERLAVWAAAFPRRILVSLDLDTEGRLQVQGWLESVDTRLEDVAQRLLDLGLNEVIVTDTGRDGTLTGPNRTLMERVAALGFSVIAAGGVSSEEDLAVLAESKGVTGAVIGRAIYTGDIDLARAVRRFDSDSSAEGEKGENEW